MMNDEQKLVHYTESARQAIVDAQSNYSAREFAKMEESLAFAALTLAQARTALRHMGVKR